MNYSFVMLLALCIGLLSTGCEVLPEPLQVPETLEGMQPIYTDSILGRTITTTGPVPIIDGRGFVLLNDTLYIVDQLKGIHIVDNSNPDAPNPISFISIPGCNSVAIIGNFLYVNNLTDIVTLDVSNPLNAIEVDRERNVYPRPLEFPEGYVGYYTCYDPSLGVLSGWELMTIEQPQCFVR